MGEVLQMWAVSGCGGGIGVVGQRNWEEDGE